MDDLRSAKCRRSWSAFKTNSFWRKVRLVAVAMSKLKMGNNSPCPSNSCRTWRTRGEQRIHAHPHGEQRTYVDQQHRATMIWTALTKTYKIHKLYNAHTNAQINAALFPLCLRMQNIPEEKQGKRGRNKNRAHM